MKAAQQRAEHSASQQPVQATPSSLPASSTQPASATSAPIDDCMIYSAQTVAAINDALSFCLPIFDLIYKRTGIADYGTGLTKLRAAQEAMKENSTG